jgi:hypothetical protein
MADEKETSASHAPGDKQPAPEECVYESNPKHSEPWQTGKKGSLVKRKFGVWRQTCYAPAFTGRESDMPSTRAGRIVRRSMCRITGTATRSDGSRCRRSWSAN